MSEEQLKAFLEAVKADAGLQKQLKAAKDVDAAVAIAKAAGFVISADELSRMAQQTELTDEELEEVTGGAIMFIIGTVVVAGAVAGGVAYALHTRSTCTECSAQCGD